MKKEYSQQDVERILKSNAQIPESVDERIRDTYRELGLIGNTGRKSTGKRTVHRKKRKVWVAVAAAAVLTTGYTALKSRLRRVRSERNRGWSHL